MHLRKPLKDTFNLAESFAREKSGGKKVTYTNPIAVAKNGGWRYGYSYWLFIQPVWKSRFAMTYPHRIMIRPHGAVLPTRMGIVEILMELSKAVCLLM